MMNLLFKIISKLPIWTWFCSKVLAVYTTRIKGHTEFPIEKYNDVLKAIEDFKIDHHNTAYMFVLSDTKSLAAMVIKKIGSQWTHAGAFCEDHHYTLEMKGSGLLKRHLLNSLHECDNFAVVAYSVEDIVRYNQDLEIAEINKSEYHYDFEQSLDSNNKLLYCSEFVYNLLVIEDHAINDMIEPSNFYGREVFSPDDVYKWGTVVYEHKAVK